MKRRRVNGLFVVALLFGLVFCLPGIVAGAREFGVLVRFPADANLISSAQEQLARSLRLWTPKGVRFTDGQERIYACDQVAAIPRL